MERESIFQQPGELDRLEAQNNLLASWEAPIYRSILAGEGLRVLDIGSNNGSKTVDRFRGSSVAKVVGLEYDTTLAKQAQAVHGGGKFSFFPCDVEDAHFPEVLADAMARTGVEVFDIIHLSLVLMHLRQPDRLLSRLRQFLAPGGQLLIIEPHDQAASLTPDPKGLFRAFEAIHAAEPLSGDRTCIQWLPEVLEQAGYQNVCTRTGLIWGVGQEALRKQAVFDSLCSYIPEDVEILIVREPENETYQSWKRWMDTHLAELRRQILAPGSELVLGIAAITCERGEI